MEIAIPKLRIGMKVKCLNCGETIELTKDTFLMDCVAEYIYCPKCDKHCDVQYYHRFGEVVD